MEPIGEDPRMQDFGSDLIRATSHEIYKLCYPKQSQVTPLELQPIGRKVFIREKAHCVLLSMGIDENKLDVITIAESIYNERWKNWEGRPTFTYLSSYAQQDYLDAANRLVNMVISGDYHA